MESSVPELTVGGKVKWFNPLKGYGFILDQEGREFFVHYSEIEKDGFRTLKDGDLVEFTPRNGTKGLAAHKVRKIVPKEDQEPQPLNGHGEPGIAEQAKALGIRPEAGAHQHRSDGSHIHIDAGSNAQSSFVASAAENFREIGHLSKNGRKTGEASARP
jgi:cold shock protein